MPDRRHVHTRTIRAEVFVRDDGLWDVEAELVDTKARDFQLATGVRPAGEAIHRMRVTLTVDTTLQVVDVHVVSLDVPYPGYCDVIEPAYRRLIGLNLLKGFRRAVRERLGGSAGCTHLTELTDVMPTAAVQAFAGEVLRNRDTSDTEPPLGSSQMRDQKPFQLDRCHALRTDGPAVARFYPRWHRGAAPPSQDLPETQPTAERQT